MYFTSLCYYRRYDLNIVVCRCVNHNIKNYLMNTNKITKLINYDDHDLGIYLIIKIFFYRCNKNNLFCYAGRPSVLVHTHIDLRDEVSLTNIYRTMCFIDICAYAYIFFLVSKKQFLELNLVKCETDGGKKHA